MKQKLWVTTQNTILSLNTFLWGAPQWMSFIELDEWEQLVMSEVTQQNNEYVNSWISKLSPVTLAGIFKLYSKLVKAIM